MLEFEKVYLAKYLPEIKDCKKKEIIDIYLPLSFTHPTLRIRKNGEHYEMTKKELLQGGDNTTYNEQTIILTEQEFHALSKVQGKKLHKIRYYCPYQGRIAEIGVFQGALKGLILIDFEFQSKEEKDNFKMPDFCLADISHEECFAGGMLCGKSYTEIEKDLERFHYKEITQESSQ